MWSLSVAQSVNFECHFDKRATLFYYLLKKKSPNSTVHPNPTLAARGRRVAADFLSLRVPAPISRGRTAHGPPFNQRSPPLSRK